MRYEDISHCMTTAYIFTYYENMKEQKAFHYRRNVLLEMGNEIVRSLAKFVQTIIANVGLMLKVAEILRYLVSVFVANATATEAQYLLATYTSWC